MPCVSWTQEPPGDRDPLTAWDRALERQTRWSSNGRLHGFGDFQGKQDKDSCQVSAQRKGLGEVTFIVSF